MTPRPWKKKERKRKRKKEKVCGEEGSLFPFQLRVLLVLMQHLSWKGGRVELLPLD